MVKYIRTHDDNIIVFSTALSHSDFFDFKPKSAGFISFGAEGKYAPTCTCYGESGSLKLKSLPDDTALARKQIAER